MATLSELSGRLTSVNLIAAADRVGGDEELLVDIAGVYLTEYPTLLEEIQHAVSSGDAAGLLHAAHTLKGSLATIGAEEAASIALQLEMMGRESRTDGATEALLRLEAALAGVHRDVTLLVG
jgi:HPt (histidine-containing phosphotransfer) domain-containing protein